MRRLRLNLSALVEIGPEHTSEASAAISARVALGEQVADWLDPLTIAALAQSGLAMDLSTGNLSRADGLPVQTMGLSLAQYMGGEL